MKFWMKAALAGVALAYPLVGFAAIDNTHHDTVFMFGAAGAPTDEKCAYCHSITNISAVAGNFKSVGGFCVAVCHNSTSTIAGSYSEAAPGGPDAYGYNYTTDTADVLVQASASGATGHTILENGHGMDPTLIPEPDLTNGTVSGTGWPHTTAGEFECTSCHSVHDATNPPFLNAPMSATANANVDSFCQRCHAGATRAQDFTAAGAHPTEFAWDPTAASTRAVAKGGDAATIMNSREISAYAPNYFAGGALDAFSNAAGDSWTVGGHIMDTAANNTSTVADTGTFGCYSCHSAHQDRNPAGTQGVSTLTLMGGGTGGLGLQVVCYQCHAIEPGTSGFGHPIDDEVSTSSVNGWTIPIANGASIAALAKPATYETPGVSPWCVTCHDVHGGAAGVMAIRSIDTTESATNSVCLSCHEASFSVAAADAHHPGTAAFDYTAWNFNAATGWATIDNLGNLTDGLSCPDCHIGDATPDTAAGSKRATAHNW